MGQANHGEALAVLAGVAPGERAATQEAYVRAMLVAIARDTYLLPGALPCPHLCLLPSLSLYTWQRAGPPRCPNGGCPSV